MKKILFLIAALFLTTTTFAQTWTLDKAHARLGFTVVHMLVSDVEGSFKSFDAKVTSSKDDFSDAVIELTADASSVNTDNDMRDNHLRGADFFDVAKYPALSFKSKSFRKTTGKNYILTGDLTMHGITKPVELAVTLNGINTVQNGAKKIAGFKISGTLKRSDFEVGSSMGAASLSNEITIIANAEFNQSQVVE